MPPSLGPTGLGLRIAAIVAALWLADRTLLWMEGRGWIYWRRSKGTPSRASAASAALEIQALLEPEKRYVLVLKKEEKTLADDEGAHPPIRARPIRAVPAEPARSVP